MTDFQPMNFVVGNIDDPDTSNIAPKAPANTPTALVDASFVDDLGIDIDKMGTPGSKFVPPTVFQNLSTRYLSY